MSRYYVSSEHRSIINEVSRYLYLTITVVECSAEYFDSDPRSDVLLLATLYYVNTLHSVCEGLMSPLLCNLKVDV